ncbi:MAG: response regulator [Lachnospiraceae bacterium]|nr:response regulator [Lachnospiraceae bacterium]
MNRKRVMIIDDDTESLELMKKQLEALYEVEVYTAGAGALAALAGTAPDALPDLILLDIVMNGMDGYEVLDRLKANDTTRAIPVVFLTGMTDEMSEIRGLEMNVVDYLKKPVAGKVLFARIQHYLGLYGTASTGGKLDEERLGALPQPLTDREMEVAKLMGEFRSDREICDMLYISMPYTKKLVAAVKEKLALEKRGDIRRYLVT